jgi:1,4-dihydroxy-2-naphthoyl-CoA hydrolase
MSAEPSLDPASLEDVGAFLRVAGLIFDEITATRVSGHLDLSPDHQTPWGIVHGGVYTTAVESAASVGASTAVRDRGQVAVGLTNTTHFLRSVTEGRVTVKASALSQGRTQQLWRVGSSLTERCGCRTSPAGRPGEVEPLPFGLSGRAAPFGAGHGVCPGRAYGSRGC